MLARALVSTLALAAFSLLFRAPAMAQGEIEITQAKANAGGVTPGDAPGFPVTLSRPGAYILAGNLQASKNDAGLFVTVSNVDIDLNGFRLAGANRATYGLRSIAGESRIHNGVISGFKFGGIFIEGDGGNSWVIQDLQVINNGGHGISVSDSYYTRVLNNSIIFNGGAGLVCRESCHVEHNNISSNNGDGVNIGSGTVLGNAIFSNISAGIRAGDATGFGDNTLARNNAGGNQTFFAQPLDPNHCVPAAPAC